MALTSFQNLHWSFKDIYFDYWKALRLIPDNSKWGHKTWGSVTSTLQQIIPSKVSEGSLVHVSHTCEIYVLLKHRANWKESFTVLFQQSKQLNKPILKLFYMHFICFSPYTGTVSFSDLFTISYKTVIIPLIITCIWSVWPIDKAGS